MPNKKVPVSSNDLASLRGLILSLPSLSGLFGELQQIRLVIDSNVILEELIWLTKHRTNPSATTALQEVIASGTVIAYAPMELRDQVEKHFPRIARREGIPAERLQTEWGYYQSYLNFREADPDNRFHVDNPDRDPGDLPFIHLYSQVNAAAIVSRDKDIQAMGATTIRLDVMVHLRDYARAKAVEVSIALCGTTIFTGTGGAAAEVIKSLTRALAHGFARVPDWLKAALFLGAVLAILHPKSRASICQAFRALSEKAVPLVEAILPLLEDVTLAYCNEKTKALRSWEAAANHLPTLRQKTAYS